MKRSYFAALICCFFLIPGLKAQTNPRISQRLPSTDVICEGVVTAVESNWNQGHTMINSVYHVTVYSRLTGTCGNTISFSCAGGRVNNDLVVSSIAPGIKTGDNAVFFFHNVNNNLELLPGEWGVIRLSDNGSAFADGNIVYNSAGELRQQLEQATGHIWDTPFPEAAARISTQTSSVIQVSSFSPISIPAGNNSILTIQGTGFGNVQGIGRVLFTNADIAGLIRNVEPYPSQYISWSDTLIQVAVPSLSYVSTGTAGTGLIEVENNAGMSSVSTSNLIVPYALINILDSGVPVRPDLVNDNLSGGYTILLSDSLVQNTTARQSFFYSLERWRCGTLANFIPDYLSNTPLPVGADGINIVRFDSMSTYILGVTYSFYTSCAPNVWRLAEFDIDFNNQISWNFSSASPTALQQDFQSCCMQLLGFALLLDNVIDPNDVMYSDPVAGTMRRSINANNIAGETDVLNLSALPNSCGPQPHQLVANCAVGAADDASIKQVTWPFTGFCQGNFPVKVTLVNYGSSTLSSAQINWKLDGVGQTPFSWTGTLLHNDSLSVNIGTNTFIPGAHTIEAWTSLPNGNTDTYPDNDTAYYAFTIGTCVTANSSATAFNGPTNWTCPGVLPVSLSVHNYGPTTLNYAEVHWKVNGVLQPTYTWTGAVNVNGNSPAFTVGTYNFTQASNTIKVWTANPNGVPDSNPSNDTLNAIYAPVGLNGVYTVGGASPNYPTFSAAMTALNNFGMCGPVTFNLRPGTYTGGVTLSTLPSAQRPLLIQSENGDSSTVIITCASGNNLTFTGSDYVTLRKMTLLTTDATTSSVVAFATDANNNTVENCVITMPLIAAPNQNVFGVATSGTPCDSIVVRNCSITGGSKGMQFSGINPQQAYGVVVSGCTISQQYDACANMNYCNNLSFRANELSITSANGTGLALAYCNGGYVVSGNEVHAAFIAVSTNYCVSPLATKALFSNNFFTSTLGTGVSVDIEHSSAINFYNNTVRASATAVFSYGASSTTIPHLNVANNVFCNFLAGPTYVFGLGTSAFNVPVFDTLLHNAYYQSGDAFGTTDNSGTAFNFAEWQGIVHADSGSFILNPQFVSSTDLHIIPAFSNLPLEGNGIVIPLVSQDIDGQPRNAAGMDIGADEFAFSPRDAATSNVQPGVRACSGINPVTVRLSNFGTTTLTSAIINWKVNNVLQTAYSWNGSLASMGSIDPVTIGSYNFPTATTYTIQVWVTQPNAGTDPVPQNDTTTVIVVGNGMSGTYTIGGASPDYTTMAQAATALNTRGVCGAVTFRIRAGTYAAATFNAAAGASSINTITFLSDNGDSSTVTTGFTFTGAGYYHVHQVTLSALQFTGAKHIHVSNCNSTGLVGSTPGTISENVEIDHSRLSYAFGFTGYSLHNGNFWVYYKHKQISIHDNDFAIGGVVLNHIVGAKVYGNRMLQDGEVSVLDVFDTLYVAGNFVNATTTNGMTIDMKSAAPGIHPVVKNNMLSVQCTTATEGLAMTTENDIDVLNNTVRFVGMSSSPAFRLTWQAPYNYHVRILNNNISNFSAGHAMYLGFVGPFESDYNNFYTNGSILIVKPLPVNVVASLQQWTGLTGADVHSMSVLPQFVSSADLHANNDVFLLDQGIALPEVITDIDNQPRNPTTPDIGADEFSFIPVAANDAGVSTTDLSLPMCQGMYPVKVNVRNYGNSTLTNVIVNWKINAAVQTPYVWNGSLATLDTTGLLTIGNFNFMAPDTYTVKVWTSQPNASIDGFNQNDTSITTWITPQLSGIYTVGGSSPDFPDVYTAQGVLNARGICGPVIFNLRPGYHLWGQAALPVNGASAVNTITFQSETGDSTSVNLSQLNLGSTAYFHIHQVSLSGFTVGNGSNHIQLSNCVFNSPVNGGSYQNEYFMFNNNLFNSSVTFAGASSNYEWGNVFRNNKFVSCATLMVNTQENVVVEGNTFDCPTTASSPAISVVICRDSSRTIGNYINGNYTHGIYMNGSRGATRPVLTANNMIIGGSNMNSGIQCAINTEPNNIYNNSVYTQGNVCLNIQNGDADVRNNIFHNANASGYTYLKGSSSVVTSDNNVLYSSSPTLAVWQSTSCTTLVQLQTVSGGMETNSLNVDPVYVSANDLHILNPALDGAGVSLSEVNVDYDLEPRQTPPDIGADERNFYPNDIGIVAFVQPIPACEGVAAVSVTLKNFGMQNLASAVVQWTMGGIPQPAVNWSGTILTGGTATVALGNYTFQHATSVQLKAWAEQPNGVPDLFALNDTLASLTILPRMSGTFTVGGASPDYIDFTSAVSDLMTYGVCGPVIFNARNGTYNEQLSIGTVTGSSPLNNIIFQSESGDSTQVTLSFFSGSTNNYLVKLQHSNDITFRKMSFKPLSPSYGKIVVGTGNLERIRFNNNIVTGENATSLNAYDHTLFDLGFTLQSADFYIDNNILKSGGLAVVTTGPGSFYTDTALFITNNSITDQYLRAIEFSLQSYTFIKSNIITTNTTFDNFTAIRSMTSCRSAYIGYNRIYGFDGNGLTMNGSDRFRVNNNFISVRDIPPNMYVSSAAFLDAAEQNSFYNNSFVVWGDRLGGAVMWLSNGSLSDTMKNNCFAYIGSGGYAVRYYNQSMNLVNISDYNNYYSCGDTIIYCTHPPWNTFAYTDLVSWQTAMNRDMNSVEAPPQYLSMDDLHILSNSFIDNRGTPLPQIGIDIDGQARNAVTPDIGADEFSSLVNDAAAVSLDATTVACNGGNVSVIIGNFGTNALSTVDIHWSVNGIQQPIYYWTGNLPPSTFTASIVLGTYVLTTTDTLLCWTELPNGVPDSYPQTDSSCCNQLITVTLPSLGPDITVCSGTPLSLFPGAFSSYLWSDASTSSTLSPTVSGTYWVTVTNPSGCIMSDTIVVTILPSPPIPTITQNGGNLLSSSSTGNQWYLNGNPIPGATSQLYVAATPGTYMVIVTDPNGCSSISVVVTVVGIHDHQNETNSLWVYPNPSTGSFNVELEILNGDNSVTLNLFDTQGRVVWSSETKAQAGTKAVFTVNGNLTSGMYLLEVKTQNRKFIEKVIIEN